MPNAWSPHRREFFTTYGYRNDTNRFPKPRTFASLKKIKFNWVGVGMVDGGYGTRRYAALVGVLAIGLTLVGCGEVNLLPHGSDLSQNENFKNYNDVVAAYSTIVPGETREADLSKIGFDAAAQPNAEQISYLGVIERFMPRDSIRFDHLASPVRTCIEAQERCSAYVFHPSRLEQERTGSVFLDLLGFERTTVDKGWAAEVVVLVQDGRVAYKVMSGKPHIEGYHDDVQPLGPFQELGVQAVHISGRFF